MRVMINLSFVLVLLLQNAGAGLAFQPHPPMRYPGAGWRHLESYTHRQRRLSSQTPLPTLFADSGGRCSSFLLASEGEPVTNPLEDMLEKFAMPLDFKKIGASTSDSSSNGADATSSKGEGSSSTTTEEPSSNKPAAAGTVGSFTPSADTPLANMYYEKKMQIKTEETKKADKDTQPTEEKATEETVEAPTTTPPPASAAPPRRRFTDFGIASEQAEPVGGKTTVQDTGSEDSTAATTTEKPRGFTDFSITRQQSASRPFKINIDKEEETTSLSGISKPPAPASKADTVNSVGETKTPAKSEAAPATSTTKEEKQVTATAVAPAKEEATSDPAAASPIPAAEEEKGDPAAVSTPAASPSTPKKESAPAIGPAGSIYQPPSAELVQTQPATSPANSLTLPSMKLDVEDLGFLPLIIIGISVYLALGVYLKQVNEDEGYAEWDKLRKKEEDKEPKGMWKVASETKTLLQKVKDAGTAGAISYALWEAAFWGVSIPVCLVSYRQVTGHWPDLTSSEDLRKVGLEAFAFVNFARLAVPIRIGLALSTVPWVEENIMGKSKNGGEEEAEVEEDLMASTETFGYTQSAPVDGMEQEENDNIYRQPQVSQIDNLNEIEEEDATSTITEVEERLNRMEAEASRIALTTIETMNAGIDPSLLENCEPGEVNDGCSESIQGYLDSMASTGAVATDGEVKAIVGYLDSLSRNVTPNENTGVAFTSYLDALSEGSIPAPSSAKAVASYLDVLTSDREQKIGSRVNEVEERLGRLEASVTSLPDDIASRLVDWQISQDKKLNDEMEKIMKLLVEGKSLENRD